MNLYSIYDNISGQLLGTNKTAKQIECLFGIASKNVNKAARKGSIVGEKYRIIVTEKNVCRPITCEMEDTELKKLKKEWDEITSRILMGHAKKVGST